VSAGPVLYYSSSSEAGETPQPCEGLAVYGFVEGGNVEEDFLDTDAARFGDLVKRLHSADPEPFEEHAALQSAGLEDRLGELGLNAEEIEEAELALGAYPLQLLDMMDESKAIGNSGELREKIQGFLRSVLAAGAWLRGRCTSRMVLAHCDLHPGNIMAAAPHGSPAEPLLAIDFETARMAPAVVDLSTALLRKNPESKLYTTLAERWAVLQAYDPVLAGLPVTAHADELWDLECGVLLRFLFMTIVVSYFSDKLCRKCLVALGRMIPVMEAAVQDPARRASIVSSGIIRCALSG